MDQRRDLEQAAEQIEELFADLWQVFPFTGGRLRALRPQVDCYRTDGEVVEGTSAVDASMLTRNPATTNSWRSTMARSSVR